MERLIGLLLFVFSSTALAQNYSMANKKPGYLVVNDDTLYGEIALHLESNDLLYISEAGIHNYPARDVKKVVIQENGETVYTVAEIGGTSVFIKQLITGSMSLFYREPEESNQESGYFFTVNEGPAEAVALDKKFFDIFGKDKKDMKDYAFSLNIDERTENGAIQLIRYYNENYL